MGEPSETQFIRFTVPYFYAEMPFYVTVSVVREISCIDGVASAERSAVSQIRIVPEADADLNYLAQAVLLVTTWYHKGFQAGRTSLAVAGNCGENEVRTPTSR